MSSALTRGIVLDTEINRLIIEARPADVARYTLNQAVDVLARQSWATMRLGPGAPPFWDWEYIQAERQIPALLRTRCDCTKTVVVLYPPPSRYQIPLALPRSVQHVLGYVTATVREFRFKHMVYKEEITPPWESVDEITKGVLRRLALAEYEEVP